MITFDIPSVGHSRPIHCQHLLTLALLLGSLLVCTTAEAQQQSSHCSIVEQILDEVSALRGLAVKREIPCAVQNKQEVREYLLESVHDNVPKERLHYEEIAFKRIGFIPEDYDYLSGLIDLYTSQLGGYYDPKRQRFVMAAWIPLAFQLPVAVHELTHAIQDQHFDLSRLLDQKTASSDELLARSALAEGDATALMIDYDRFAKGKNPLAEETDVSSTIIENLVGAAFVSTSSQAPRSLQAMMLFPYLSGLRFAHALLRKDGYSRINEAFSDLPKTTEEILHPEKFGKSDYKIPATPRPPTEMALASEKPVFEDSLGEFTISALLSQYIPPNEASAAAMGWGGDKLAIFKRSEGKHILAWVLNWDNQIDASEFFSAIAKAYRIRFAQQTPEVAKDRYSVTTDNLMVDIVLTELKVVILFVEQ